MKIVVNNGNNKNIYSIYKINNDIEKIVDKQNDILKGQLLITQTKLQINENNNIYLQTPKYNIYSQSVIYDKNQKVISNIKESYKFFNKRYKVYNENNILVYIIKGNIYGFKVYKYKKHIANINASNLHTNIKDIANNTEYNIDFLEECTLKEELLLLSALLHIDKTYIKKSIVKNRIKKTFLYSFYALLLSIILILGYRANYIFSITDDLVLDNNISMDIKSYEIEKDPAFTFDKDFLYKTKEIYNSKIYEYNDDNILFTKIDKITIQKKKDFEMLLELYLKKENLFVFKNDDLYYRNVTSYDKKQLNSLLMHFQVGNFYYTLIHKIKYLDSQNKYKEANKLLKKLIKSLNNQINYSYQLDYIISMAVYKAIFEELTYNSKERKEIFKNNDILFDKIFYKRLKLERIILLSLASNITNVLSKYYDMSKYEKNKLLQINTALYKKQNKQIIPLFKGNSIKELKKLQQDIQLESELWYIADLVNSVIFSHYDYHIYALSNVMFKVSSKSIKNLITIKNIINMQKKFLN